MAAPTSTKNSMAAPTSEISSYAADNINAKLKATEINALYENTVKDFSISIDSMKSFEGNIK